MWTAPKLTLKQFLGNYTSASGSLKFGMMIDTEYFINDGCIDHEIEQLSNIDKVV